MSEAYGPDDTWPVHKKVYWRPVLAEARAAEWTLTYVDAPHTFGHVICPAGEHSFKVDGTARGAELFAKEASKTIRLKCRHGASNGAGKVQDRSRRAAELLEHAEQILNVAEAMIVRAEQYAGAWAIAEDLAVLAEQLRLQLATAGLTVTDALRAATDNDAAPVAAAGEDGSIADELARVEERLDAELALADALDPPAGADTISTSLAEADQVVDQAEAAATALDRRRPALARPLLDRARAARVRIQQLSARLVTIQELFPPADG